MKIRLGTPNAAGKFAGKYNREEWLMFTISQRQKLLKENKRLKSKAHLDERKILFECAICKKHGKQDKSKHTTFCRSCALKIVRKAHNYSDKRYLAKEQGKKYYWEMKSPKYLISKYYE